MSIYTTTSLSPKGQPEHIIDLESPEFDAGKVTATMGCFLWFEPFSALQRSTSEDGTPIQCRPEAIPTPDFLEFCTRLIRRMGLSNQVALLGLLLIYRLRLKNPIAEGKGGSKWGVITVALMVAHKGLPPNKSLITVLEDCTYATETWANVSKVLHEADIITIEIQFLTLLGYNLYVSSRQWEDWIMTASGIYSYNLKCLRKKVVSTQTLSETRQSLPTVYSKSGKEVISTRPSVLPQIEDASHPAPAALDGMASRKRLRKSPSFNAAGTRPTKSRRTSDQIPQPRESTGESVPVEPNTTNNHKGIGFREKHPRRTATLFQSHEPSLSDSSKPKVGVIPRTQAKTRTIPRRHR